MFDINALRPRDQDIIRVIAGDRAPDVTIAPDGEDYLHRWYVIPRRVVGANVYLHLQVADDPERPLHDHPWDCQSCILAGGYREVYVEEPSQAWDQKERVVCAGCVVQRKAEEAHRLFLLPGEDYTISLFSMGPVVREWGFWFEDDHHPYPAYQKRHWRRHDECVVNERFIGEPHA